MNLLKELNSATTFSEPVGGFANVFPVLKLFNSHRPQNRVDMLIIIDKMSDSVMLICGQGLRFTQLIPRKYFLKISKIPGVPKKTLLSELISFSLRSVFWDTLYIK